MKRILALCAGLALLMATPGLASAYPQRPASNQQAINLVIARALAQRGVPYTYGGGDATGPTKRPQQSPPAATAFTPAPGVPIQGAQNGPGMVFAPVQPAAADVVPAPDPQADVVGFDASGLIVYAFAGAGLKLPRSSGEQYKVGRKILPSQALPGDLIFYGPDGTQSVTLFLGNGQMLEATTPAVQVSPIRTNGMAPYLSRIIE